MRRHVTALVAIVLSFTFVSEKVLAAEPWSITVQQFDAHGLGGSIPCGTGVLCSGIIPLTLNGTPASVRIYAALHGNQARLALKDLSAIPHEIQYTRRSPLLVVVGVNGTGSNTLTLVEPVDHTLDQPYLNQDLVWRRGHLLAIIRITIVAPGAVPTAPAPVPGRDSL